MTQAIESIEAVEAVEAVQAVEIIKIVAVLRAKAGHENTVKEALQACVKGSRAEDGCEFYDLHIDRKDPRRFVFIEGWQSETDIVLHQKTKHYLIMKDALVDLLESREVLQLDELSI